MKEVIVLVTPYKNISVECSIEAEQGLHKKVINAIEKPLLEDVLLEAKGNQLKAARILGINRNTLRTKVRKLGIDINRLKYGRHPFPPKTRSL